MISKGRVGSFAVVALVAGTVSMAYAGPPAVNLGPAPTVTPAPLQPKPIVNPPVATLAVSLAPPKTRASYAPVLATDGNEVYALLGSLPDWGGTGVPITVARSTDGGASFGAPVLVATPSHFTTRRGSIAARGGQVVATWISEATLYYAISTDHGATFSKPFTIATSVSVDGYGAPYGEVAFSSAGPVVVWQRGAPTLASSDPTARVFFARLGPSGVTNQVQLSREPFGALHPRIGTDKSRIVVAFAEDQNPIYLLSIAESADDGKTWNQIANAAEGNPGLTLSDAERAALRFPTNGTSKPIWKLTSPFIDHTYVFGGATIVSIANQPSLPDDRAIVAADPGVGLFRGRSASLRRCAEAAAVEPQPLAPREQPVFNQYERTPWLFAQTAGGTIVSAWAQGYKSTVEFRSRMFTGRFTGAAVLSDCHMVGENVDFRPAALGASGELVTVAGGTARDAALGSFAPGAPTVGLRHVGVGPQYVSAALTSRGAAFAWLDRPATDFTGGPRALGASR